MATLPYVTAPGNIEKALNGIKAAATPETVSQDFVKSILKIPGGSGSQITSWLKKTGFANADGSPSDIYKSFRNPTTTGKAALQALKRGYAPLYKRNEYMHAVPDEELRGLIVEETGQARDSSSVGLIFAAIRTLRKFVPKNIEATQNKHEVMHPEQIPAGTNKPNPQENTDESYGINLSYTINLNLPATSDPAVFNAIFKSLRENLLKESK